MIDEEKNLDTNSRAVAEGKPPEIQSRQVSGKFRKVKMDPIAITGRYRGNGNLQLKPEGLQINGRHVFSLGVRWAIGLGIFFGSLILSIAVTGGAGYCAPGFIPIYFLVEYFILKREDILVPYSEITHVSVDSQNSLIGLDFKGNPQCSPVFLNTAEWSALSAGLQRKLPGINVSDEKIKRKSPVLVFVLIAFVCIIIIGIIAAIAIPNLLVAKQRAMQKAAMMDIQKISTALLDYILDNPEPSIREWSLNGGSELYHALVPDYSNSLPAKDPWGNEYRLYFSSSLKGQYGLSEKDIGADDILVVSYGRDGLMEIWFFDADDPEAGLYSGFSMDEFDNDLVMWNGSWIRRPR